MGSEAERLVCLWQEMVLEPRCARPQVKTVLNDICSSSDWRALWRAPFPRSSSSDTLYILIPIPECRLSSLPWLPRSAGTWPDGSRSQAERETLPLHLSSLLLLRSQLRILRPFLPLYIFLLHKEISLKEKKKSFCVACSARLRKSLFLVFRPNLTSSARIQIYSLWGNILIEFLLVLKLNSGVIFILYHGGLTTQFY